MPIILIADYRLIIEKHGCHSLKSFGHRRKSVTYPFKMEKSIKWAKGCVVLAALPQSYVAIHSVPGANDIFMHSANKTSDFFMEIHEGQLLGFAWVPWIHAKIKNFGLFTFIGKTHSETSLSSVMTFRIIFKWLWCKRWVAIQMVGCVFCTNNAEDWILLLWTNLLHSSVFSVLSRSLALQSATVVHSAAETFQMSRYLHVSRNTQVPVLHVGTLYSE